MNMHEHNQRSRWFQSRITTWVLLGFLAIGAFFLVTEHTAHVLGFLPYALFLLCPLMMLFMHSGHESHGSPPADDPNQQQPPKGEQQ
jgi:hypothetical protein